MKKILLGFVLSMLTYTAIGQTYVDLGLSVKWATENLGQDKYNLRGTKCSLEFQGEKAKSKVVQNLFDNNNVLLKEYDIANQKNGGKWRMPTIEEWNELTTKCSWKEIPASSSPTYTPASYKVTGPSGNSIIIQQEKYLTSSLCDDKEQMWHIEFNYGGTFSREATKNYSGRVRPVYEDTISLFSDIKSIEKMTSVDIGMDVEWATCNLGASSERESGHYYTLEEAIYIEKMLKSSGWRLPTEKEVNDLKNKCIWKIEEKDLSGYDDEFYGYYVKNKGKYIYFPMSGCYREHPNNIIGRPYTSTLKLDNKYSQGTFWLHGKITKYVETSFYEDKAVQLSAYFLYEDGSLLVREYDDNKFLVHLKLSPIRLVREKRK